MITSLTLLRRTCLAQNSVEFSIFHFFQAAGTRLGTIAMSLSTVIACTVYAFINGWKLSLVVLAFIPLLVIASAIQMRVFAGGKVSDHGEDELVQAGKVRRSYILF